MCGGRGGICGRRAKLASRRVPGPAACMPAASAPAAELTMGAGCGGGAAGCRRQAASAAAAAWGGGGGAASAVGPANDWYMSPRESRASEAGVSMISAARHELRAGLLLRTRWSGRASLGGFSSPADFGQSFNGRVIACKSRGGRESSGVAPAIAKQGEERLCLLRTRLNSLLVRDGCFHVQEKTAPGQQGDHLVGGSSPACTRLSWGLEPICWVICAQTLSAEPPARPKHRSHVGSHRPAMPHGSAPRRISITGGQAQCRGLLPITHTYSTAAGSSRTKTRQANEGSSAAPGAGGRASLTSCRRRRRRWP